MTTTIAAVSTAAGPAERAIVRASGPEAIAIAERVFTSESTPLGELGGFRTVGGWLRCGGLTLPGRAYLFRSPRSYTRQDLIELHLPGHPLAASAVLEALLAAGAELAEPGQFTRRAFLSGRIDLSAAEAVADIIAAATDAQLRAAEANAAGALHRLCAGWSETVAASLAEVEASIDMAEEGLELIAPAELADRLTALAEAMGEAMQAAASPPATSDIPRVALAGAPNVGKSSILNALTGLDRAIVSATAGATRDVLSAPMSLGDGREILLVDLAGLAEVDHLVAAAADSAARTALASADAVLAVTDLAAEPADVLDDIAATAADGRPLLVLANKADLLDADQTARSVEALGRRLGLEVLAVSAASGEGLDRLKTCLGEMLAVESTRTASPVALHGRQRQAIDSARQTLLVAAGLAGASAEVADEAEFLAIELRSVLTHLGTISGDSLSEDLLGRIFSRFCVGK